MGPLPPIPRLPSRRAVAVGVALLLVLLSLLALWSAQRALGQLEKQALVERPRSSGDIQLRWALTWCPGPGWMSYERRVKPWFKTAQMVEERVVTIRCWNGRSRQWIDYRSRPQASPNYG